MTDDLADTGAFDTGAFDRRLDPALAAPLAVAFSGGGDSLAALLLAKAWADRHGRPVIALTVDHRLQPAAEAWTAFAAETAVRLGVGFRALAWEGDKPARGLPAAARAARHRLLADAARAAGASVIVLGHTADDVLEGELMRAWGSNLGALRSWSPSPAWPRGRGVFLLRPLLGERRAAIRSWLEARGQRWIDDPANVDPSQTRARARVALAGASPEQTMIAEDDDTEAARLADAARPVTGGGLAFDRSALVAAPAGSAKRVMAAAALSVGGGVRPPRGERLRALLARLAAPGPVRATLCGARFIADGGEVLIVRDAGEAARGGLVPLALPPGEAVVWDGRLEIRADRPGLVVRPLAGLAARLDAVQARALRETPAPARPALPALVGPDGTVNCPVLASDCAQVRDLVRERMRAACGAISKESAV